MIRTSEDTISLTGAERLGALMTKWASRKGEQAFVLDGEKISAADFGVQEMLFPLLAWHADNIYSYGVNKNGMGATFEPCREAMLGVRARIDTGLRSFAELSLFMVEAAEDVADSLPKSQMVPGAVELRPMVNAFAEAMGLTADDKSEPRRGARARPEQ